MFMKALCASVTVLIAIMYQMDVGDHCIVAIQDCKIKATRQQVFDVISDLEGYARVKSSMEY